MLEIFQGENRRVEENLLLGKIKVKGIPRGPKADRDVEVRFTYDLNGILEVEAVVLGTGRKVKTIIQERPGKLSPRELEKALDAMQALKTHPREDQPNRLALAWGQRLYREVSGTLRRELTERLDAFENALESGDKERIEDARNDLEIFLSFLEGPSPGEEGE